MIFCSFFLPAFRKIFSAIDSICCTTICCNSFSFPRIACMIRIITSDPNCVCTFTCEHSPKELPSQSKIPVIAIVVVPRSTAKPIPSLPGFLIAMGSFIFFDSFFTFRITIISFYSILFTLLLYTHFSILLKSAKPALCAPRIAIAILVDIPLLYEHFPIS